LRRRDRLPDAITADGYAPDQGPRTWPRGFSAIHPGLETSLAAIGRFLEQLWQNTGREIEAIKAGFHGLQEFFSTLDLAAAGANMINSLLQGMRDATERLLQYARDLAARIQEVFNGITFQPMIDPSGNLNRQTAPPGTAPKTIRPVGWGRRRFRPCHPSKRALGWTGCSGWATAGSTRPIRRPRSM
jgi:hypothetical protein